jgi:hypothetical protein
VSCRLRLSSGPWRESNDEQDATRLAADQKELGASALSGIFGVALYRYALDNEAVGGFTAQELESAVKPRGGRNAPPTATPGTV